MESVAKRIRKPRKINLEASTVCQLNCPTCPTASGETGRSLGKGFLRLEDFKTIVCQNPSVSHIELSNWGEIFLNPELEGIIKYAYRKSVALYASNGTNLNRADERVLEALVKYKVRRLGVSLDGTCQESYSTYRRNGNIDQVLANVRTINRFKEKYKSDYPAVTWQFIVFGHNEHEISQAREMAAALDMDFRLKLAWDDLYTEEPFSPVKDRELVKAESGLDVSSRKEYQDKYGRPYLMNSCCSHLWAETQVNYDGRLLGCPINFRDDYGNILTDGLSECMSSAKIRAARDLLMGKETKEKDIPCLQCSTYQTRKENRDWLTEADLPRHYPRGRFFVMLENRIFGRSITKLGNLWRALKKGMAEMQKTLIPLTARTGRLFSCLLRDGYDSRKLLHSGVYPLHIPLPPRPGGGWNMYPLFAGQTGIFYELTCHASVLSGTKRPHPPHTHSEEELLLLFAGELDIIRLDEASGEENKTRLSPGQFIYYPAALPHTVQSCGESPANYMMFKWRAKRKKGKPDLGFSRFSMFMPDRETASGFAPRAIFEQKTAYLKKLHCHTTALSPGAGYDPHCDPYDVAIIVLEGEVETLGQTLGPHGAAFYAAGEPHGMRNPGRETARYIVFEFHG